MNEAFQIFPMNEVGVRATMADNAKSINIYQGHIRESGNRNILTLVIRRDKDGNFPAGQLEYVNRLKGNFTAVLMPGREYFYISSSTGRPQNQHEIFNWSPFQDDQLPAQNLNELVQRIIDLEKENDLLRSENIDLKEELSGLETGADKFSYALEQLFYKVAPKLGLGDFSPTQKPDRSMNAPDVNDWQTFDVSGNTEDDVQRALGVLLFAFGEDYVLRFARKLQQNPSLVNTLKSMI